MIYQPMTDSQAEDAWFNAYTAFFETRYDAVADEHYARMQHIKRNYSGVIPVFGAALRALYTPTAGEHV